MSSIALRLPEEFDVEHVSAFLKRSPHEILHQHQENGILKFFNFHGEPLLTYAQFEDHKLVITGVNRKLEDGDKILIEEYFQEWLDLKTNLRPFYELVENDNLLGPLIKQYYGYRVVGMPDLFESLIWAVTGQQINLNFAHLLKQRLIVNYGECLKHRDKLYYAFPTPHALSNVSHNELLPLQFSRQKSKYITGIAQAFEEGAINKEMFSNLSFQQAKEKLTELKGVGNWTANYVLMKTFHFKEAFPIEDAGLHNALKNQLKLPVKPGLEEIRKIFERYKGWESYAVLYLWKSL